MTLEYFRQVMSFDAFHIKACIEINFSIKGSDKYADCWMGKMPSKDVTDKNKRNIFWFGGIDKKAYEFYTFDDMINAAVFDGCSLCGIWNKIEFYSVDGCDPEYGFSLYISEKCE